MKKIKKYLAVLLLLLSFSSLIFANNENNLLLKGLEAYKQKDWTTALFFLRKATTMPENVNPETWYVLIMSEVYASDFEGVLTDGMYFVQKFSTSPYVSQIEYQMARVTFLLEDYNQAFVMFSDFCKKYPKDELYSSALFWQAECLYQLYNLTEAEKLFKEIVTKYPESPKMIEAAFRLELLEQRAREEKLLYLLRMTGEENLAAREDYERQIKQYQSEESINIKMKVTELSLLVESLQEELNTANNRIEKLLEKVNDLTVQNQELKNAKEEAVKQALLDAYEKTNEQEESEKNEYQNISDEFDYYELFYEYQKMLETASELETYIE